MDVSGAVSAAAIPAHLAASYRRCRDLHRRHGRSYYLATRLLPAWKRPHVHALYGFTRHADDIVDVLDEASTDPPTAERERGLRDWMTLLRAGLDGHPVDDPLLPAIVHTIRVFGLDQADIDAFFRSMAADLTASRYPDYPALLSYMEGSAAAIGTMMLSILESADPDAAREPARQLGFAFQLTNFIRDVAEDAGRGRIYLPQTDLARFGLSSADVLHAALSSRIPEAALRSLIAYEVGRARAHYAAAEPGIALLAPSSRSCVRTAFVVYGAILDEVERAGYDVFGRRAVVSPGRKLRLVVHTLLTRPG